VGQELQILHAGPPICSPTQLEKGQLVLGGRRKKAQPTSHSATPSRSRQRKAADEAAAAGRPWRRRRPRRPSARCRRISRSRLTLSARSRKARALPTPTNPLHTPPLPNPISLLTSAALPPPQTSRRTTRSASSTPYRSARMSLSSRHALDLRFLTF
jgi:hypothetical protein